MYLLNFCTANLSLFRKHNTSNTYNDVIVSILQSLNSCLQDVLFPTQHVVLITLFCSLNIDTLSFSTPQKLYHILLAFQILTGTNFLSKILKNFTDTWARRI